MATKERSWTLPSGTPRGLNQKYFRRLLSEALEEYRHWLSRIEPKNIQRHYFDVCRSFGNEIGTERVQFPCYEGIWPMVNADDALLLPRISAFFNYVWRRNELRLPFRRPTEPTRQDWEKHYLRFIFHSPLCLMLEKAAIEEAVDTGQITIWRFPEKFRMQLIDELVAFYYLGRWRIMAKCPMVGLVTMPEDSLDLGHNLFIKRYSAREWAIYITENSRALCPWNDLLMLWPSLNSVMVMLEIIDEFPLTEIRDALPYNGPVQYSDPITEYIERRLADRIDIVKWAIFETCEMRGSPAEGIVTYSSNNYYWHSSEDYYSLWFQRGLGFHHLTFVTYSFTPASFARAKTLIAQVFCYRDTSKELQPAFFHWGRASVSFSLRDKLIESVIGLEPILVSGAGESRYRFGLHGAALLSENQDHAEKKYKELQRIYDERSSAVHGKQPKTERTLAEQAHKALGDAIRIVLQLFENGILMPGEEIAKQIERLVIKNAALQKDGGIDSQQNNASVK